MEAADISSFTEALLQFLQYIPLLECVNLIIDALWQIKYVWFMVAAALYCNAASFQEII